MKKILIVDDDIAIQETLSEFIAKLTDYKTVTAEDGETAIDQMKSSPPDLVILDLFLPRIGGVALFKDMKKSEATRNIPVIFITGGLVEETFKKEGIQMGAVDYITKPLDMTYLIDKVKSVLG